MTAAAATRQQHDGSTTAARRQRQPHDSSTTTAAATRRQHDNRMTAAQRPRNAATLSAPRRSIVDFTRAPSMLRPHGRGDVRVPSFLGYNRRMRILLSNDDGYLAPGLAALHEALKPIADVTVMAPEQN